MLPKMSALLTTALVLFTPLAAASEAHSSEELANGVLQMQAACTCAYLMSANRLICPSASMLSRMLRLRIRGCLACWPGKAIMSHAVYVIRSRSKQCIATSTTLLCRAMPLCVSAQPRE